METKLRVGNLTSEINHYQSQVLSFCIFLVLNTQFKVFPLILSVIDLFFLFFLSILECCFGEQSKGATGDAG